MKTIRQIILFISLNLICGCYPGIKGTVVDSLSGTPLEGAVIVAQWTTTSGFPGLTHHSVYKITEAETDKNGEFSISGVYNPFVSHPAMLIYKKGYVPWRNDMDFKDKRWTLYDDILWKDNLTYQMERWKDVYTKRRLNGFVHTGFMGSTQRLNKIQSETMKEAREEQP